MPMGRTRSGDPKEPRLNDDGAAVVEESSIVANAGGTSQPVVITAGASAPSAAINAKSAVVSPTVDCFMRHDAAPVATNDGTDQFLFGGVSYRVTGITPGNKLAFRAASGNGTVYITPSA